MKDLYKSLLKKLAHFQVKHPYLIFIMILLFTVAMLGGAEKVRTVASLEQMMPSEIEEIKAFNTLRDNGLGQDMVAIIIELNKESTDPNSIMDITDERVYNHIKQLKTIIADEPDVLEVYDYTQIVDQFYSGSYQETLKSEQAKQFLTQYINNDKSVTYLILTTDISANDPRMNLLSSKLKENIESLGHPTGITTKLTGTPIIQQKLGEMISHDRKNTQWISTLLVFIITMIIFGTLTSAVVPIIVVTLSVNWLYGTMGYTNLPISTLAGGVAAMVIGIGIDFAIHIMNKFKYERKKGKTVPLAIESAVVETGTALTATSLTTISAFLAFLVGAMPEMGRFGILMAIGIFYSLVFSIFGLPAILILEEKLIYWLKKKLKFGIEGELKLKNVKEEC